MCLCVWQVSFAIHQLATEAAQSGPAAGKGRKRTRSGAQSPAATGQDLGFKGFFLSAPGIAVHKAASTGNVDNLEGTQANNLPGRPLQRLLTVNMLPKQ